MNESIYNLDEDDNVTVCNAYCATVVCAVCVFNRGAVREAPPPAVWRRKVGELEGDGLTEEQTDILALPHMYGSIEYLRFIKDNKFCFMFSVSSVEASRKLLSLASFVKKKLYANSGKSSEGLPTRTNNTTVWGVHRCHHE